MTTASPAATSLPSHRQRPLSPTRVLEEAEEQWVFTERELDHTPSIRDGMKPEVEREIRAKGIGFIREVGIMLKLPELTLAVAALFFNRFLMRNSLVSTKAAKAIHHYTLGATALFLATKVEECCRKMKELVIACCRVAQKNPNLLVDDQSKDFWKWRDTILSNEDVLLESLCFDLTAESPHKQLYSMLKLYRLEHNKRLRNAAWAFVTDSLITQLCLLCPSRTIASAALYSAARLCNVRIPDDSDGRPWWEAQRVGLESMIRAANYMAKTYECGPPADAATRNGTGAAAAAEGSKALYVGLLADFDAESSRTDGLPSVWDRTRLKSEQQGITTPPRPAASEAAEEGKDAGHASVEGQHGGQKRVREGASASVERELDVRAGDEAESSSKRRKTVGDGENDASKEDPGTLRAKAASKGPTPRSELSEEGEVAE